MVVFDRMNETKNENNVSGGNMVCVVLDTSTILDFYYLLYSNALRLEIIVSQFVGRLRCVSAYDSVVNLTALSWHCHFVWT